MRLRVNAFGALWALSAALVLAACAADAGVAGGEVTAARVIENGPAADYPLVLGEPYDLAGITYTPADTWNVDEVGYADADAVVDGEGGVTAAHHTLPLPSYVEVTALDSGKTALVRVERRGPVASHSTIALSTGALAQLGIGAGAPVRVRRVNPPEDDRAELRADRAAPLRMATPAGLLEVLRRRLPAAGSASLSDPRQAVVSGRAPDEGTIAALEPKGSAARAQIPNVIASAKAAPVASATAAVKAPQTVVTPPARQVLPEGNYAIQVGSFSVRANAEQLAKRVGGTVLSSGRFSIVRTGPFVSRGQAEEALAKLRRQGYSGAQIRTQK